MANTPQWPVPANRLGYDDSYYFSRLVKKIMGQSLA